MRRKQESRRAGRREGREGRPGSVGEGARVRVARISCLAALLICCFARSAGASVIDDLLGLRTLSWSDADASLGWAHPLPAWVWVLVALAASGLAGWSYSRLLGPRPVRMGLALLRSLVILSVAVLLAGPTLIDPREREEPDALVVLVDRSGSMRVGDMIDPDTGEARTRDAALRDALVRQAGVFGEEGLGASPGVRARRTVWLGFGEQVYELPPLTSEAVWDRPEVAAQGSATALRTALEQALRAAGDRPLAGIVLFSDGRTPQSTGVELVKQLTSRGAPVHVVPLGAAEPPLDLAIGQVSAPREAFAEDVVPIGVTIDRGGEDGVDAAAVRVRLIDAATGEVLDERGLEEAGGDGVVELSAQSQTPGRVRYRVEVERIGGERELITDNNRREVEVQIVDRPIRVLYVEGYPRWEYRYLKNTLIREESIDSSMLLISADRAFAQEGDSPITRPPTTPEEMRRYDVVILGDVPPGYFTPEQLMLLRSHVVDGGGLMWIGGPQQTPAAWAGTPLEDLLPMRNPSTVSPLPTGGGVRFAPAPLAERLNVLRLHGPGGEAAGEVWVRDLPPLQWAQGLGPLKPAAEVLARAGAEPAEAGEPLLVRLRYGGGQSLYLATDETWRWRYGRGELYFEQFWVQLVRMLGRSSVQQNIDRARFVVSHRRVNVDEPVVVEVVVDDPALTARELPQIAVTAEAAAPSGGTVAVDQLQLRPVAADEAGDAAATRRAYRAVWRPGVAGTLTLRVTEPALVELNLVDAVEVVAADDELRHVATDHARLAALAEATGGQVVPLDELDRLVSIVPNLAEKVATDVGEPLWHSGLAFAAVLALLSLEWIVRKAIWLV